MLVQSWKGRLANQVFFFFSSYTLLKPSAICSEARDAFPRLNCQSNAKYIGALLLIPLLRGFVFGVFALSSLLIQPLILERNYQSSFDSGMIA